MNRIINMLLVSITALAISQASAFATIVSHEEFDLGYGSTSTTGLEGLFIKNNTASANTPTTAPNPDGTSFTVGDVQFTVDIDYPLSGPFSTRGPHFTGRVFQDGSGDHTSQSSDLTVTVSAVYTGTYPPPEGSSGSFKLGIDQISVYGLKHTSVGTTNEFFWTETTAGHGDVSPSVFLNKTGTNADFDIASNYTQLSWNPGDWTIDGTSITRTFQLPNTNFAIDALEIIGFAEVVAIPEPITVLLLGLGGLVLVWWRRRQ